MTITRDEDVIGGEPRIEGTRIGVRHIAVRVIDNGQSPAHVADQLDIPLEDVYDALGYYYANLDEIRDIETENKAAFDRLREDHGIATFALAHHLVKAHSDGDVTLRQISSLADLSPETTYDLVEAIYSNLDLGDSSSSPTTYTPADFDPNDEEVGSMPARISNHFDRVRDRLDEETDDSAT